MTQETCHGCGAPLSYHQHACDYCRRVSVKTIEAQRKMENSILAIKQMCWLEGLLQHQQPLTVLRQTPRPTLADFLWRSA